MSIDHNKLDRFLDQALSDYSIAEPNLGFESRILAHLQAAPNRPTWFTLAYAAAATVILAAAVYGEWRVEFRSSTIAPPQPIALRLPAPDVRVLPRIDVRTAKQTLVPRTTGSHLPSVISARPLAEQPLSEQEKLLLAFARENPQELPSTVEWQEHMRRPAEEQIPPDQGER